MRPELVIVAVVVVLAVGAHVGVFLFLRHMARKAPPRPKDAGPD